VSGPRYAAPLRVILVIGTLDRGGTEGQVVALAGRLTAKGHHVTVLCLTEAGAQGEAVRAAGVDVVEVGLRTVRDLPFKVLHIRAVIRDRHPDVVHCFLYWANLIGAPLARTVVPRAIVLTSERSLQDAIRGRPVLRPWSWLARRCSDAIVCNSRAVLDDAVQTVAVPRKKAVVIRNGVEIIDAVGDPPSSGATMILAIANLIAYKGLDVLLEAFAQVLEGLGEHAARLQVAGAGPEEGKLRAQAAGLDIEGAVEFLGSVAPVAPFLARCSFTVLPSYSEGMPNAVLESLAAGRAVIGTRVGGTAEILAGGGGILVPPGDPDSLARAMRKLISQPSHARELGEQGRRIVRDHFSMDQMVDATERLYTRLLVRRRDRGGRDGRG
jgi:glycosyltransferase involved in cell wall biosynthesis